MKFLFDQNLSFRLCDQLEDLFPGSQQVRILGLDRANDMVIWEHARKNDFVIVTQDADFYEISLIKGAPPKVIWLRCGNQPTNFISGLIRNNFEEIVEFTGDDSATCIEIY